MDFKGTAKIAVRLRPHGDSPGWVDIVEFRKVC